MVCPDLFINRNIDFAFFPRPSEEVLNKFYSLEDKSEKTMRKFSYSESMQKTANYLFNKAVELNYINEKLNFRIY